MQYNHYNKSFIHLEPVRLLSCKRSTSLPETITTTTPKPNITSTTVNAITTTIEGLMVPVGIEKLNKMLDPSRMDELEESKKLAMEKYRKEFRTIDMEKSYRKLFEIMWYSQMPCFDVQGVTSKAKDEMSMVKRCLWKGLEISCSAIFDTRPTDRGMCCTFNMDKVNDVFRRSRYRDVVYTMQEKDSNSSFDKEGKPDW